MNIKKLKELLEKNRFSIRKCSEIIGMTPTGFTTAIENQTLPIKKVLPLCELLGTSVNDFFDLDSNDIKKIIGVQNNAKGGNVQNNSDCKEALKILNEQLKTKDDQIKMLIEKIK